MTTRPTPLTNDRRPVGTSHDGPSDGQPTYERSSYGGRIGHSQPAHDQPAEAPTQAPVHAQPPRYTRQAHGMSGYAPPAAPAPEPRFDPRAWRAARNDDLELSSLQQPRRQSDARPATPSGLSHSSPLKSQAVSTPAQQAPVYRASDERAQVQERLSIDLPQPAVAAQVLANEAASSTGLRARYIAVWAVLGSLSAAYLAGMAWQRSSNFNLAVAPITEAVERLAGDVAELRQTTTALDARERQTAARLNSAESRIGRFSETAAVVSTSTSGGVSPAAAPALAGTQVPQNSQRPTSRIALAEDTAPAAIEPPARPQRTSTMPGVVIAQPNLPGVILGATPSNIPSDVRADGRPTPPAAKAAAAPSPVNTASSPVNAVRTGSLNDPGAKKLSGLLVGSGSSMDAIRQSWTSLSQNHGGVMGLVEPRINPSPDGSSFQLIAGPYSNDFEAAKACSNLRARGVTCRPVEFTGAPL